MMAMATAAAASKVRRAWKLRLTKCVTDTPHGVDESGLAIRLQLAAQVGDVDLQGVRARAEVIAPDLLEDLRAGEDHSRMAEEELKQPELGTGELHLTLTPAHLHRAQVHDDVGVPEQALLGLGGGTPQERPDTGEELVEGEGLDQVVVGPGVEPLHPVADRVPGGEDQDRGTVPHLPHPAADLNPVHQRQPKVEDHGIVTATQHHLQRLPTVVGKGDVVPLQAKRSVEGRAQRRIVVDDQDLQRSTGYGPYLREVLGEGEGPGRQGGSADGVSSGRAPPPFLRSPEGSLKATLSLIGSTWR